MINLTTYLSIRFLYICWRGQQGDPQNDTFNFDFFFNFKLRGTASYPRLNIISTCSTVPVLWGQHHIPDNVKTMRQECAVGDSVTSPRLFVFHFSRRSLTPALLICLIIESSSDYLSFAALENIFSTRKSLSFSRAMSLSC